MKALVTGAAGFIGSHLCEALLLDGHEVLGLDSFVPYYDRVVKEANLRTAQAHKNFRFFELDLRTANLTEVTTEVEVVFHLAAMPGLVWSWSHFDWYDGCNVLATQRLLDAVRTRSKPLRNFIYASTSSIYGKNATEDESMTPQPISPYGVTKLGGEHLCESYREAFGIPVVRLRYFSVYGPRQRPDMGYFKFIDRCLRGEAVAVYGSGEQARGNTYVTDCVRATMLAVQAPPGSVYNVGGGEVANVWDVLRIVEDVIGKKVETRMEPARPGDQALTRANTARIERDLRWHTETSLRAGLTRQIAWQREKTSSQ